MRNDPLAGIESLAPRKAPKKVAPKEPKLAPPKIEDADQEYQFTVRVPRTTPAVKADRTAELSESGTLIGANALGKQQNTEERREKVLAWILDGHIFNGMLMTVSELAVAMEVPLKTVQADVSFLKEQMAEFHTTEDLKDIPALAHMIMEMKFQDRGRALALYNIIMGDIRQADADAVAQKDKPQTRKQTGLTGRDRAAMYSAALTALDLSNKATNGMESLFKLTGGAKRLENIIKAKNLTVNINNPVMSFAALQDVIAEQLSGVLPSTRKLHPELPSPSAITLDSNDKAILAMGNKK